MKINNYRQIRNDIKQDFFQNAYLFFGEEKYLINQLVHHIVKACIAEEMQEIDLVRLHFDQLISAQEIERLQQEIQTPAFFSERRVIIAENTGIFGKTEKGNSEKQGQMIDLFQHIFPLFNAASCLILLENSVDLRRKKLLDAWEQAGGVIAEISKENLATLRQWLQVSAQQKNLKITGQAAESLIDRCESDMTQIEKEMSKVLLYAEYSRAEGIDREMIDRVCCADLRGTIFNLTDAITAGDAREALRIFTVLISQKEPLPLIRFMFSRHIKQLICAKEVGDATALSKTLKIYPQIAKRLSRQAARLTSEELEEIYRQAFLSDWQVKQGQMKDQLSFEMLLLKTCLAFQLAKK